MIDLSGPETFFVTIPHSGTRYVHDAVREAYGLPVVMAPAEPNDDPNWYWTHVRPREYEIARRWIEYTDRTVWQLRSPIGTFGTHLTRFKLTTKQARTRMGKGWALADQFNTGIRLVYEYPSKVIVTRCEDGLAQYGLPDHTNTHTVPSKVRDLIRAKDLDGIERELGTNAFWRIFRDQTTPAIAPFYEEHGYDIWWK